MRDTDFIVCQECVAEFEKVISQVFGDHTDNKEKIKNFLLTVYYAAFAATEDQPNCVQRELEKVSVKGDKTVRRFAYEALLSDMVSRSIKPRIVQKIVKRAAICCLKYAP